MHMNVWQSGRESRLLDAIMSGHKTIEGRLNKGKFANYSTGDIVALRRDIRGDDGILRDGDPDQVRVEIIAIRHYESFLEMVQAEGFTFVIPTAASAYEAADEYNRFYSVEDQAHYGVLAIEVRVRRDWDKIYRSGHDFSKLRDEVVDQIVAQSRGGNKALDIGCGLGNLARQLAARNFLVTAIDPSTEAITRARLLDGTVEYRIGTIGDIEGRFDLITCKHVIAFIDDKPSFVRAVAAHLRPGGVFAVVTPTLDRVIDKKLGIAVDRASLLAVLEPAFEIISMTELPSGLLILCLLPE